MTKIIIYAALFALIACAGHKKASNQQVMSNEPFIIYKTKADYNQNVPVILNDDKTVIVSYPGPYDLEVGDKLSIPTVLTKGYLLDNRGIALNVAFTSFTYSEYAQLDKAPSISELFESIIDNDPILEMYNCKQYLHIKSDISKINKLINRDFKGCQKLK